jgi:hypothetical protein
MGRSCCRGGSSSSALRLAAVGILSLGSILSISGCGNGTKAGPPLFPGKVNLTPSNNTSVELGATFAFTASAQTATGTNLNVPITYSSSDTAIVTVAPNGVACAGHWDVAFTTCTPGGTGLALVTASALKESSVPTYVFVHPPVDSVTVTGILLDGVPVQEPCLSQGQAMTLEAHAFSQGSDVTSSVGPFTFSAQNPSVVNLVGVVNTAYNFATNQTTATAVIPGMTQIYASASGVSSSSFHQPQYQNSQGITSPVLDFFETCPIQSISLEVGLPGSQQTLQTTFVASSSQTSSQTATAVLTDVMGNTSLPNTINGIVLSKIPLTWSASQPAVVGTATGCQQSCVLRTPLPGSGSITASCSPPTCNIGFPLIPASLSTPAAIASCTQFFHAQFPQLNSCQQLIPLPVYASPPAPGSPVLPGTGLTPEGDGAISGLVTGTPAGTALLATSMGCAHLPTTTCSTSVYSLSTARATPGPENPLPASPNSLLFDPAGDKAFMGSDFGALLISPANFGTSNSPFTGLGTVTGKVLATSNDGTTAVFADTLHTPNQVYVVNAAANSLSATPLNISQAVASAFSPDGLKAFIFGNGGGSLYVYSPQQALQGPIALAGPVNANSVAFSSNGAFAFVAEAAANSGAANLTAFNTCNNQVATSPPTSPNPPILATVPLPGNPLFMKVLPGLQIEGRDSSGYPIPDGQHVLVLDATGVDILTSEISPPPLTSGTLCPQFLTFVSGNPAASSAKPASLVQRVELGQGTIQPINFFASADSSQLYVVAAGHASILVYNFAAGAVTSGIELLGNATPLSADMSADAGTILIAGSDGLLHEVSTGLGGSDQVQLSFPNLPDYLNSFCAYTTTQNPCTLNLVAARP